MKFTTALIALFTTSALAAPTSPLKNSTTETIEPRYSPIGGKCGKCDYMYQLCFRDCMGPPGPLDGYGRPIDPNYMKSHMHCQNGCSDATEQTVPYCIYWQCKMGIGLFGQPIWHVQGEAWDDYPHNLEDCHQGLGC